MKMLRKLAQQLCQTLDVKISSATVRSICSTNQLCKENVQAAKSVEPEDESIKVEKDKNITLIGINRPKARNAINSKTARKLCEAFTNFEADEGSTVAVLYGLGGSFSAGYDVLELGNEKGDQVSIDILMTHEGSVGPTRRQISKPVVCGISGYCVAGGLELALMCDLRVMEEQAVLGFFNRRFGVPVIDGGTVRLPAMIGFSRALDLILTGRPVSAEEAHQIGIANRIVPKGTSLCYALELARTLSKFPQGALRHDRNSLYSNVFEATNFNQAIQNEIMYTSKEIIEDMQAGIKWFNNTFKDDSTQSWLKRDKSMADWDDDKVASAAEVETARIAEQKKVVEAQEAAAAAAAKKKPEKTEKAKNK